MTSIRKIRKRVKPWFRWLHNDVAHAVRQHLRILRKLDKNPLQS